MSSLWYKLIFKATACVVIPIAWGWIVHQLFVHFASRRKGSPPPDHDPEDDYQI